MPSNAQAAVILHDFMLQISVACITLFSATQHKLHMGRCSTSASPGSRDGLATHLFHVLQA
jgi:hypothetical protein